MIMVNGFIFKREVLKHNPDVMSVLVMLKNQPYRIDRSSLSEYYYLWIESKQKYYEIETDKDLSKKENANDLIKTYEELFNKPSS